jgi:hypothetical protein
MAKRHYESKMKDGAYSGEYARRTQEMQDAGMIGNDMSAIANLPQNVMMKPWPDGGSYMPEDLDDTIKGINEQVGADDSKRSAHNKPHKY